ncbi:MAG: glycosyltransferase family 2 protein [Deltaproteobacteria bacterium]|nr:glycosyltransferase family 2 protein [Deltaproteobacteria bacterium]
MPFVSVIIPTRGRDACVRQTLRDLGEQDFRDFDVWLVDQNDKPLAGLPLPGVALVHEKMPPLGSHAGRNHAIFRTSAEVCVFVDDDVRLEPGFLAAHARAYREAQGLACVAGRVVQPRDGFSEEQMRRMGRPARYNRWIGTVSGNFVGVERSAAEHIHECNFSARTSALRAIGGFNEEFRGNAYFEGADLALRLIDAGFAISYRPDIALTHLQDGGGGNRVSDKARHTYWYMRNYALLGSLHMRRIGLPFFGSYGFAYVLAKAAKNGDASIAVQGLKGLADGLKYFIPGRRRLRTRNEL